MSLIVVDVGNTSTAVGLWTKGEVKFSRHCDGGFDEASKAVEELLLLSNNQSLRRTLEPALGYASVVPKVDRKWRSFAKSRGLEFRAVSSETFKKTYEGMMVEVPHYQPPAERRAERRGDQCEAALRSVTTGECSTLRIDYPKPETIGADRLADAAGALSRYGAPVIVMDFGTALTAAVITSDGTWRGGVIAPGLPLMCDYLAERTAQLPRIEPCRAVAPKIGRTTEEAMTFGMVVGFRGIVREIVAELRANFNEDFKLVATGGFARWATKGLDLKFIVDPTLTLFGTGILAGAAASRQ